MQVLLDRLNVAIDKLDFKTELARLLRARGFSEHDAAEGVQLILRSVRCSPVESGLKTNPSSNA